MGSELGGGLTPPKHPPTPLSVLRSYPSLQRPDGKAEHLRHFWTGSIVLLVFVLEYSPVTTDEETSTLAYVFAAMLLPAMTAVAALVTGLPIRLIPPIRSWWIRNGEIAYVGILLGCGFLFAGYLNGQVEEAFPGAKSTVVIPEGNFMQAGWLMLAFFTTHSWMPPRWRRNAQRHRDGPIANGTKHVRGL
jgi:hypothetical protein